MALTQEEIVQVTLSVSSYKSRVSVCPTTATIYFLQSTADALDLVDIDIDEWKLIGRGAPAIIQKQNKGKKEIEVCIIEIGTGFIIWRDTIESTLEYKSIRDNFHTFSKIKGEYFGFQLADQQAAISHYQEIEQIIAECKNREAKKRAGFLKNALLRRNKQKEITKSTSLRIRKDQISQPCMFKHVTALDDEFLNKTSSAETSDSETAAVVAVQYGSAECLPKLYDQTNANENWPELSTEDKRKRLSRSITVDSSDSGTIKQTHSFTTSQAPDIEQAKIIVQSIKNATLQRQKRMVSSEKTAADTQDSD